MERVKQCIKMGMSVDERDTDTWTPLHYACWSVSMHRLAILFLYVLARAYRPAKRGEGMQLRICL